MAETSELTKYLKDFLIQSIKQKKGVFKDGLTFRRYT
jgi:hypothetical protein